MQLQVGAQQLGLTAASTWAHRRAKMECMEMLETRRCRVEIDPDAGGRIAQIVVDGVSQLVGRRDTDDDAFGWGSYPMVPWAGRIRRGRFRFDDVDYELTNNMGHHAIHGVGYDSPWTVDRVDHGDDHGTAAVEMSLALDTTRWPFGGVASQRIQLRDDNDDEGSIVVDMSLSVTATEAAMPVSIGWHPWFRKPASIDFRPSAQYVRDDDWITLPETTPARPGPWDDTFINDQPVVLHYPDRTITIKSPLTTWVVFDMPTHATCVEPQTAPPDAFTIAPHRLGPGETLAATSSIAWSKAADDRHR